MPELEASVAVEQQVTGKKSKKRVYRFFKRVTDIVLALIGLVVSFLPMLIIFLLIKLETPGPGIYVHHRIGKNRKPLPLLKFRTRCVDADRMIEQFTPQQREEWEKNFKLDHDPRVTRIGRFLRRTSLDELPQLVNILKGELSIVGPRPVVTKELERYRENQDTFLSVTPGLTGYWQAYARSDCSYEERMQMELHYVENASFWWDIKIMFATIGATIRGRGAK